MSIPTCDAYYLGELCDCCDFKALEEFYQLQRTRRIQHTATQNHDYIKLKLTEIKESVKRGDFYKKPVETPSLDKLLEEKVKEKGQLKLCGNFLLKNTCECGCADKHYSIRKEIDSIRKEIELNKLFEEKVKERDQIKVCVNFLVGKPCECGCTDKYNHIGNEIEAIRKEIKLKKKSRM